MTVSSKFQGACDSNGRWMAEILVTASSKCIKVKMGRKKLVRSIKKHDRVVESWTEGKSDFWRSAQWRSRQARADI